jgi:hypothetical protein
MFAKAPAFSGALRLGTVTDLRGQDQPADRSRAQQVLTAHESVEPRRQRNLEFSTPPSRRKHRQVLAKPASTRDGTTRSERDWQKMILNFLLLIFPKYVAVLSNVKVVEAYSAPGSTKDRFIDLALIDAAGNIDVVEIKKPFDDALMARTPYRDNYIPTKELSGSIMQAEKYLFHLSKWGLAGEKMLAQRYSAKLPPGMGIRITSPKAMIILGRDRRPNGSSALDASQQLDLEIIKPKYANMIDVLTYDDLLRRLDNIIASLHLRAATQDSGDAEAATLLARDVVP